MWRTGESTSASKIGMDTPPGMPKMWRTPLRCRMSTSTCAALRRPDFCPAGSAAIFAVTLSMRTSKKKPWGLR